MTIHAYFDELAALFRRPGVWQVTPPQDYRDRMAQLGAPAVPQGGYPLTNHGGSTLRVPKLVLVYLGDWWGDTAQLEAFANDLMTAGYLAPLSDYGSGQGAYIGAVHAAGPTGLLVTDGWLQSTLIDLIATGAAPAPDGQTLYALMLPAGVSVSDQGSESCSQFCAYHDALADGVTFYTVQADTSCANCNLGDAFAALTMTLAHEVAEACTDAVPGQGWYNDATGMENADEWAWIPGPYGPWTVQGYELNGIGNSLNVIQYAPQQPIPQPPPPQGQPDIAGALAALQTAVTAVQEAVADLQGSNLISQHPAPFPNAIHGPREPDPVSPLSSVSRLKDNSWIGAEERSSGAVPS